MAARKLRDRTKKLVWDPPCLRFEIDRHGAIVAGGSGYAEVQAWEVDVDAGAAWLVNTTRVRVRPTAPRFEVGPVADELAALIRERREDPRLKWTQDYAKVRILSRSVLPSARKATNEGRRKRLNIALDDRLRPLGWVRGRSGWWHRAP
jgi:hypothetical protein